MTNIEKINSGKQIGDILTDNCIWIKFALGFITAWLISTGGLICFKHLVLNVPWQDCRISLANFLSLGSAIGAIAVAVIALIVYKYATKQYAWQKKIDYGIDSAKKISGILHFHEYALNTQINELNQLIEQRNRNAIDGTNLNMEYSKLIPTLNEVSKLFDDFRNDWKTLITPEIELLIVITNKLSNKENLLSILDKSKEDINKKIKNTLDGFRLIRGAEPVPEYDRIEIIDSISNMRSTIIKIMELLLNGEFYKL